MIACVHIRDDAFDHLEECAACLTAFACSSRVEPVTHAGGVVCYVDLGAIANKGGAVNVSTQLGRSVRERFEVAPALGIAMGKFPVSVAAAMASPNHLVYVAPGDEATFLAPRPIDHLPFDAETLRRLRRLGIRTLGQFARLPAAAVLAQFGNAGQRFHRLARGCDDRPVRRYRPTETVRFTHQFDDPVIDHDIVRTVLHSVAEEAAAHLQAEQHTARMVYVRLSTEDETDLGEQRGFSEGIADADRIYRTLEQLVTRAHIQSGVVELEVVLGDLAPVRGRQLDLFAPQSGHTEQLNEMLPGLIVRHGAGTFYHVDITGLDIIVPEQRFRLRERHV